MKTKTKTKTNINVFLSDVLTAFKADALPLKCFTKSKSKSWIKGLKPVGPLQVRCQCGAGCVEVKRRVSVTLTASDAEMLLKVLAEKPALNLSERLQLCRLARDLAREYLDAAIRPNAPPQQDLEWARNIFGPSAGLKRVKDLKKGDRLIKSRLPWLKEAPRVERLLITEVTGVHPVADGAFFVQSKDGMGQNAHGDKWALISNS